MDFRLCQSTFADRSGYITHFLCLNIEVAVIFVNNDDIRREAGEVNLGHAAEHLSIDESSLGVFTKSQVEGIDWLDLIVDVGLRDESGCW